MARKKAIEENEEFIKKHPPQFGCDRGCAEAAEIAGKIVTLVKAGIMLGLLPKNAKVKGYSK